MHTSNRCILRLAVTSVVLLAGCGQEAAKDAPQESATAATITSQPFGTAPDGQPVEVFTLRNSQGMEMRFTNYGGIILSLTAPDRTGKFEDVTLGYDSLADYVKESPYFGALIGRYGNRIAKGQFTLDGKTYQLPVNDGPNSLHGGTTGFDKVVWKVEPVRNANAPGAVLTYTSPSGDQGYPGTLQARVTYTLRDDNALQIDYHATTDAPTPVNLTQHTYWNLGGDPSVDILGEQLTLDASHFTPVDSTLIPTGEIRDVTGTPFDFREPTAIGARIGQDDEQLRFGKGYDHNWVLDRQPGDSASLAARLYDPQSGRVMEVYTTEPGIQFYSGNFLDGHLVGKGGQAYAHRTGLALETQHFPDSPNHPNFPSTILQPGQEYSSRTIYKFTVQK